MNIHTNDPSVVELANLAFPGYKGRKYQVNVTNKPVGLKSYWDGGSRSFHKVIRLSTKEVVDVPENGTMFTKNFENDQFPCPDVAVITHSIVQGKDFGITISIHPSNANQLALPERIDLTVDELTVLYATRSLKNSYAGDTNIRFKRSKASTGITEIEWDGATHSLIEKGCLNKRGAITNEGKNALQAYSINNFYQLKDMKEGK